jgi:LysR family glycine cleavage system transcriptional activator
MRKARVRLPPMATLEAFVASGHLGSFTAASAELNLTPGAVSRQIALLEADLGAALFRREARGVELTPAGLRLHAAAQEALALVLQATHGLPGRGSGGAVRLSVTPSFGVRWLLPCLSRFSAIHPRISVTPVAENRVVDIRREGFDLAVRYTSGTAPDGLEQRPWLSEELVPVAAPVLMRNRPKTPDALVGLPFLHDRSDMFWREWLSAAGCPDLLPSQGTVFNDYNLAVGAAISGLGVLIGRTALISRELRDGTLEEAVPFRVPSPRRYFLVRIKGAQSRPAAIFWDWLLSQTGVMP